MGDVSVGDDAHAGRMDSGSADRSGRGPIAYRIVIRGEVTGRFAEDLDGVVVESAGAESILHVECADQAKLQGILAWLYGNGIELLSVGPAAETNPGE
jgi:hypothetical protein